MDMYIYVGPPVLWMSVYTMYIHVHVHVQIHCSMYTQDIHVHVCTCSCQATVHAVLEVECSEMERVSGATSILHYQYCT